MMEKKQDEAKFLAAESVTKLLNKNIRIKSASNLVYLKCLQEQLSNGEINFLFLVQAFPKIKQNFNYSCRIEDASACQAAS
ncbi:hypothetical protein T4E_7834 [Trichinella pseudospiralis]|uniref:Uncharacterized protein n=1 Tax=Trichinella pseudospiralis TaxID=6337 RepID=A0A0V0XY20_TRIPS|nr:hypothetical protein T4E_7834 [Trichinella pseudospiralis]